jgi:molybdopterin-containing oxidoreductase family membrane subunit
MAVLRKVFHLEQYLQPGHFSKLGLLLLTMSLIWFYFTFAEYLTTWYGNEPAEMPIFHSKVSGAFSPLFWAMVIGCFVLPVPILAMKRTRTIAGTVVASIGIIIGMWLERFLIIVPTLSQPRLAFNWGHYAPTWVEIVLTAGTFGYFVLLYAVFTKLFPIVAVWEYKEGLTLHDRHENLPAARPAAASAD